VKLQAREKKATDGSRRVRQTGRDSPAYHHTTCWAACSVRQSCIGTRSHCHRPLNTRTHTHVV